MSVSAVSVWSSIFPDFPLSDLSSLVATAPESVSRSLSWLDKQGLIKTDRNYISVEDVEGLTELTERESI